MNTQIHGKKVFVTGGAGFIGSRLVRELVANGSAQVLVFDNLHPQVHGPDAGFPEFPSGVRCVHSAVEDGGAVEAALSRFDPDIVVHLAAETGTGQSQDEIVRYCTANVTGTANILQSIGNLPKRQRVFLLSSSRAIYGEGPHVDAERRSARPLARDAAAMQAGDFEVHSADGSILKGVPVADGAMEPLSVYASTKLIQEHLLLNCAGPKRLDPRILRFQNVYGPGQSLRNPYTGVLSIFTSQIMAGKVLDLYEDGGMVRDFVFVDDVVDSCIAALLRDSPLNQAIDIGSGEDSTIGQVAAELLRIFDVDPAKGLSVSGRFRSGDIRYACADVGPAREHLSWTPKVSLRSGLERLVDWARGDALVG